MSNVPSTMKALVLHEYNPDLESAVRSLRVESRPVAKLKSLQVLVKIEAAVCNPSDLLFLQKRYGVVKSLPAVPGWEGMGTVVAAGGLLGRWLLGRRVAVGGQADQDGTWAEYYVAEAFGGCVPLRKDLDMEQGATLLVNPLTAVGLLDEARRRSARAVVQTAAASQVGRMILRLAQDGGVPLVNVVRRPAQVELLRELGATHVLNSSEPDFWRQLAEVCDRLQATVAFDAVGGEMTGRLLGAMPAGGGALVYGALAEEACRAINPIDLIFKQKWVSGFFLGDWLRQRGIFTVLRQANRVQKLMARGELKTSIQRRAALEDAVEALLQYKDNMTAGKVLIKPGG